MPLLCLKVHVEAVGPGGPGGVEVGAVPLNLGKNTFASGVPDNRLRSAWSLGTWLGREAETNENIVDAAAGVLRARTVKRPLDEMQWEKAPFEAMVCPPWSPQDLQDAREEAQ